MNSRRQVHRSYLDSLFRLHDGTGISNVRRGPMHKEIRYSEIPPPPLRELGTGWGNLEFKACRPTELLWNTFRHRCVRSACGCEGEAPHWHNISGGKRQIHHLIGPSYSSARQISRLLIDNRAALCGAMWCLADTETRRLSRSNRFNCFTDLTAAPWPWEGRSVTWCESVRHASHKCRAWF